jgi:hypothetical protein
MDLLVNELFEISEREIPWRQLSDRLIEIRSEIISPEYRAEEFRLRIFLHSILPNLRVLHSKRAVAKNKFTQFQMLIDVLLCCPSSIARDDARRRRVRESGERSEDHPANTLSQLDALIVLMKRSNGWWKTDFAPDLEHTVELEWLPILLDNRFTSDLPSLSRLTSGPQEGIEEPRDEDAGHWID